MYNDVVAEALALVGTQSDASLVGVIAIVAVLRAKGTLDDDDTRAIFDTMAKSGRWEKVPQLAENLQRVLLGYEPTSTQTA